MIMRGRTQDPASSSGARGRRQRTPRSISSSTTPLAFRYPLVKRIMCLDPDVSRISGGHFPPRALQMHACALCQAT